MTLDDFTAEDAAQDAVVDEAQHDIAFDVVPTYTIVSYGVDFDVTSLVKRIENVDIEFPNFQRGFVWDFRRAARFIESLLLGFPVPGIFLWRHPETERLVVVDGRQRLQTLQSFYGLVFKGREFKLPEKASQYQTVNPRFQDRTYKTLDEEDRRRLDNSIIHATVVNQEVPGEPGQAEDAVSSIYYLFERINTGGTPLQPQEIRSAIYPGDLVDLLSELNNAPAWRGIYGKESARLKDQELVLRFLALYYRADQYRRPMTEFLNQFFRVNRQLESDRSEEFSRLFNDTVQTTLNSIGQTAFRPERSLNAAVFDAVMVGVARRLQSGPLQTPGELKAAYDGLLELPEFIEKYKRATADADNVKRRLELATQAFADVS